MARIVISCYNLTMSEMHCRAGYRILLTIPKLRVGGAEMYVATLARELTRRGHVVTVASAGGAIATTLRQQGLTHVQLPLHGELLFSLAGLLWVIKRYGIEIIHANGPMACWVSWCAARLAGIPFITTAHSVYRPGLAALAVARGDRIIAVSEIVKRQLTTQFGVPPSKIAVIYNGIDLSRFRPSAEEAARPPLVAMVARLTEAKGHWDLFAAIPQVLAACPETRFWLVGDGPLRREYQDYVRHQSWAGAVTFWGYREDVPDLLRQATAVVLPSHQEAFGYTVVEAMAAGKPVIATNVGGIPEIIRDGQNGFLVPLRQPAQLAERIIAVLRDPVLAAHLSQNGRQTAETRFSLEAMLTATTALYDMVKGET